MLCAFPIVQRTISAVRFYYTDVVGEKDHATCKSGMVQVQYTAAFGEGSSLCASQNSRPCALNGAPTMVSYRERRYRPKSQFTALC